MGQIKDKKIRVRILLICCYVTAFPLSLSYSLLDGGMGGQREICHSFFIFPMLSYHFYFIQGCVAHFTSSVPLTFVTSYYYSEEFVFEKIYDTEELYVIWK